MKRLAAAVLLGASLLMPLAAFAQLQRINPPGVFRPQSYTQMVQVPGGTTLVYLSGQVAQDTAGNVSGADLATQTRLALRNLQTALRAVGADFDHVVQIRWYVVNLQPGDLDVVRQVRAEFIPADAKPASTLVGVTALFHPAARIEIEAVAAVPGR